MTWLLITIWLNGVSVTEFTKENYCNVARDHIRVQKFLASVKSDCIPVPNK